MPSTNDPIDVFKVYEMRGDDECWPYIGDNWGGRPTNRRPYFTAHGRRQAAYRWVYELVNGVELAREQIILHSCDNGSTPIGCGNPKHLTIGTQADNVDDEVRRQRIGMPKTVVRAIRNLLERGVTQQEVADRYGVSREAISAIATQRVHKSVE